MISGILPLFLNLITVNKTSEYQSLAYKIADSKLESLRAGDFETITNSTYQIADLPGGQGQITVSNQIDGAAQTGIKDVSVKISWNFKKSSEITVRTYIVQNGIRK